MDVPKIRLHKDEEKTVSLESTEHVVNVHTALLNALISVLEEKAVLTEDEIILKAATLGSKPIHEEDK